MPTTNMNIQPNKKYKWAPEEIEHKALQSERFRALYNVHRLDRKSKWNKSKTR